MDVVRIALLPGSTRSGSTTTAALHAVRELAPADIVSSVYTGLMELPAFSPDDEADPQHPAVPHLRAVLAAADAVLICTPEYAGSLPGSFKNLLDWTVGNGDLYGKPAAWINVAAPGRGEGAEQQLRTVLGYVGADLVERACVRLPVSRQAVGPDGAIIDAAVRAGLLSAVLSVAEHVRSAQR